MQKRNHFVSTIDITSVRGIKFLGNKLCIIPTINI